MWPRDLELTLTLWLLASPFVFAHGSDAARWVIDLGCGAIVAALALLPRWRRLRRVHLLQLLPAAWLAASGWSGAPAPAAQNDLVVALVLAMLAVLPSDANLPPRAWQALEQRGGAT